MVENTIPKHVAIIMDGNGRWASEKNLHRSKGHIKGYQNIKPITLHAKKLGIKYLTLFAFSTENWKRSKEEVGFIMNLALEVIIKENNIKGIIIGNPLNMDGSYGKASQSVNDISKNISKSINVDICLWDERLSTVGAFNITSQLDVNVSKREKNIDQNAATFILQGAIDFLNN